MYEMKDLSKNHPPGRALTERANRQISEKLRQFYTSVEEQEIPDRFLDLLEKLDQAENAAGADAKDGDK